jgi:hypothetical protein
MLGGPSALPISEAQCDIGPVVDTDALSFGRSPKVEFSLHGGTSADVWQRTVAALTQGGSDGQQETLAAALKLGLVGSVAWKKGLGSVAEALATACGDDGNAAAESLLANWLLPRALAEGSPVSAIAQQARSVAVEVGVLADDTRDSRLVRVLTRIEREQAV